MTIDKVNAYVRLETGATPSSPVSGSEPSPHKSKSAGSIVPTVIVAETGGTSVAGHPVGMSSGRNYTDSSPPGGTSLTLLIMTTTKVPDDPKS